ncbi:MAG: hypothetical protein MPJ50_03660 [Pirellulales bacterium]|nr:hypothetical protein [Pirellulales bacterium]
MTDSLRALLTNVIDYAGLFPPAKLPLDQSAANYIQYKRSPNAWMVGGFVCTVNHLPALAKQPALGRLSNLPLALVATPAESLDEARSSLRADLQAAQSFVDEVAATCGVAVRVAIEWRLPPDAAEDNHGIVRAVECIPDDIAVPLESVACEVPLSAVASHAQTAGSFQWRTNVKLGLKFRTGGLEAAAFPTSATLAQAFADCIKHGTPWKCTAGLHHPLPRIDAGVGARMHGFINVLTASTLGQAHKLDATVLQAMLDDESAKSFDVAEDQISWSSPEHGAFSASVAQITAAREIAMSSFGSCSCEEPWDDLLALGWL